MSTSTPTPIYTSPIPAPQLPRQSIFQYLFPSSPSHAFTVPDKSSVAYIDAATNRRVTRGDLEDQAKRLAGGLQALGLKRGDVGCIFGMNSLEWINAAFACQAAGIIVSPANYGYTPSELLHQLKNSTASIVFCGLALIPVLEEALKSAPSTIKPDRIVLLCPKNEKPKGSTYRSVEELWSSELSFQVETFENGHEKETAFLCYSSGTTGLAKGVETSHHNITSQVQALNLAYQQLKKGEDVILGILPFGHIYVGLEPLPARAITDVSLGSDTVRRDGALETSGRLTPMLACCTNLSLQVFPSSFSPGLRRLLSCRLFKRYTRLVKTALTTQYKITWGLVVPPVLVILAKSPNVDKYDLSSLRGMQCGAAPLSSDLALAVEKRLKTCGVTQGYGLTETSPVTHVITLEEAPGRLGCVGRLMPTFQARLVGVETGEDVSSGQPGELWLRGPSVMKGYWKNEEATRNTFAEGGWFKTGDVAVIDDEGYFSIVDRVKELIKYKGFQGYATPTSTTSSASDPTLTQALDLVESGTRELEEGDVESARRIYRESLDVKETSGGWFNLGAVEVQDGCKLNGDVENITEAIEAWTKSIALEPSADAYTNLASAYILSKPPQPALAIKHLTSALQLSPEDPEIAFNLAAVLESTDNLETALTLYQKALKLGIERAAQNVRSVGAKILAQKVKAQAEMK
ncbi:hypothetical protein P7C73_g6647, partial [Tremellales sp. Uapishka_1]